jgi:hypothetical protein
MKSRAHHLKDYEQVIRLIGDQLALNPDYSIELLDASFRQILLEKARAARDTSEDNQEKIHHGRKACFYSEGDPADLRLLAEIYQGINENAQALALLHKVSQTEMTNRVATKIEKEENISSKKETKKEENSPVSSSVIKWSKEDIPDIPDMPEEERAYLAEKLNNINCFLEYGSGGSTVLASSSNIPYIYSVDSDKLFLEAVAEKVRCLKNAETLISCWVDIGPTGNYGNPTDYTKAVKWPNYSIEPWRKILAANHSPDLILIDGRFRVASFLASLVFAKPGTLILFDDYVERSNYHVVEKFIKPENILGRMAEFAVKKQMLSPALILDLIPIVSHHG